MDKNTENQSAEATAEETAQAPETAEAPGEEEAAAQQQPQQPDPLEEAQKALKDKEKDFLYLRAEYDNFRRRSAKEKTEAYSKAKADAAIAFLPVYDNLERALQHGTEDTAFLQGVEMTMNQLKQVLESLDIHPIDAVGQPFDPNLHNAVMHIEDPELGENVVAACFQTGFKMGDKVIRFAMVQVAN